MSELDELKNWLRCLDRRLVRVETIIKVIALEVGASIPLLIWVLMRYANR